MDETKAIVLALTGQAMTEWTDGTTELTFPVTSEVRENPANMLWCMANNAMAYGLMKGIELGFKMAKEGAE